MRLAAACTSAKLGTSIMTCLQSIQLNDQAGAKIIPQFVACAFVKAGAATATDQAAIHRLTRSREHALLEGDRKQNADHRFEQMVVQPLFQTIGMNGAAAHGLT